jgi:hypothetical protein
LLLSHSSVRFRREREREKNGVSWGKKREQREKENTFKKNSQLSAKLGL